MALSSSSFAPRAQALPSVMRDSNTPLKIPNIPRSSPTLGVCALEKASRYLHGKRSEVEKSITRFFHQTFGGMHTSIILVPFEEIDVIHEIQRILASTFNSPIEIAPEQGFVPAKQRGHQFLAEDYLQVVRSLVLQTGGSGGLGITIVDLYVPDLNFIFGLASQELRVAVISLAHLSSADRDVFLQRCLKEAVHELGHALYGLRHCQDRSCVMAFSNCLADTDFKDAGFCARCVTKLGFVKK
jgi:archaemetzincin